MAAEYIHKGVPKTNDEKSNISVSGMMGGRSKRYKSVRMNQDPFAVDHGNSILLRAIIVKEDLYAWNSANEHRAQDAGKKGKPSDVDRLSEAMTTVRRVQAATGTAI